MSIPADSVRLLRAMLRRAQDEPHTIALLTDEELAALGQDPSSTPEPFPWISQTRGVDHELAGRFGVRSLLARGLLREAADRAGGPAVLDVPPEVRVVLDTRRIGLGYVRALRPDEASPSSKIMVVQPELGVFEEEISPQGFHLFTACAYDAATARLARWCLPADCAGHLGGGVRIPAAQWAEYLFAELPTEPAVIAIEVYLPSSSGERAAEQWMVAYGGASAVLARPLGAELLDVQPLTVERLRGLLADRIDQSLRFARGA